jgi:hypothetical protein
MSMCLPLKRLCMHGSLNHTNLVQSPGALTAWHAQQCHRTKAAKTKQQGTALNRTAEDNAPVTHKKLQSTVLEPLHGPVARA